MANGVLITPGNIADLSPDSYAVHPFDALTDSVSNLAGTVIANTDLSDRAALSVSYTESGRDAVAVVAEGQEIVESETKLKNVTVPSVKLAVLKTASNEILSHSNTAADTGTRISEQALQDLRDAADTAIFRTGSGDADTGLTPLATTAGITDLEFGENLDWLSDALANIVDGGGRESDTVIVASPAAQAALLKLKDATNGNRPLVDTLSGTSQFAVPNATGMGPMTVPVRNLAGVPILVSRNLSDPAGGAPDLYVIDRPNLLIAATEATMAISKDAEFSRDATAFRGTLRLGWKLARPERVSRITITDPEKL
ncbi:phage major capsid protein [Corynebacterium flavescens]|uniref:phage major capsid protein n=1 Tax=Corynebacterium flavescens TaxID=28028 RepID=UPI003FD0B1CA